MCRRLATTFILMAVLLVPALAGALPRPEPTSSTAQESQVGSPISVAGSNSVGVSTPSLTLNKTYRFHVTGTWKPSGSASNNADAGFETTDGIAWTRTGKGLLIGTTNYGASGSPLNYRSSHDYSITYVGQGGPAVLRVNDPTGYGDNSGALTVTIYEVALYTYTTTINPTDYGVPGSVTLNVPQVTVPAPPIPGVSVPPTTLPGAGLPSVGSVQTYNQSGFHCLSVTVSGITQPLGCVVNPGGLLQPISIPIGGNQLTPPISVCQNPPCTLPGSPGPITVGGSGYSVPAGSTLSLRFMWTGDMSRLWRTPFDDGTGANALVAPFDARNIQNVLWYQQNLFTVRASIDATIIRPDGQTLYNGNIAIIPGLGQVLEAMFETKVANL